MTLDEAIKHAEQKAEHYYSMIGVYHTDEGVYLEEETRSRIFAEEQEQLADYLKDYKRLLENQKTGHWIYIRNSEVNGLKIVKCSECDKRTYGSGKYCPNCGAKMEGE